MPPAFEIVRLQAQHIMSIRLDIDPAELAKSLGEIFPEIWRYIANAKTTPTGPPFSRTEMTPGGLLGMEAGLPVAAPLPAQGRIQPKELPGGDAARAVHIGPYAEIPKTQAALLQWALDQGREPAGPAWLSFVTDPGTQPDPTKWQTEIFLPLRSIS
jgi:effector-binding domain-containing protein